MKKITGMIMIAALMIFGMSFVTSAASTGIVISKNSMTIQTGETAQLSVTSDGTAVEAVWGSSDTSVASVSSTGLVTGNAAGSAVITAMADGQSVECLVSVVRKSTDETIRYNVLILDTSGSMKGKALKREKEAAKRFCQTVLESDGNNYLAVVTLNTSSEVICDFTNNMTTLTKVINSVHSSGGTNMNQAMVMAGDLLDGVSGGSNVVKNVVLCSDGLPKTGVTQSSGKYKASDHEDYRYANAVYSTDKKLKNKGYFVYALGFFHNSTSQDLVFGKKLMKDLASKDKYYVVTDAKDIDQVFQNVAEKITKTSISKSSLTLYVGKSYKLSAQVNGVTKKGTWKSSKPGIATVNSNGKVTAKAVGKTTITTTVNGQKATCKVTVKQKTVKASIRLNKKKASIRVKKSIQLKATVTGKSKKVKWTSSNKSVATVSKSGKVTAKRVGTTVITAKANGKAVTCKITVTVKHPDYSQYFMVEPKKSQYGSKIIDEYGCRLLVNSDAVITKCAVYLKKVNGSYQRTLACTGTNIQYAYYMPYLARNGKTVYDGTNVSSINVKRMYQNSDGIWSISGTYLLMTANIRDGKGSSLAVYSKGTSGRNTKIFSDLDKMKKWLKK